MKPAEVRFYFDADILGLGKLISGLRPDCTYPVILATSSTSGNAPRVPSRLPQPPTRCGFRR